MQIVWELGYHLGGRLVLDVVVVVLVVVGKVASLVVVEGEVASLVVVEVVVVVGSDDV
jgi:hypothetical protein